MTGQVVLVTMALVGRHTPDPEGLLTLELAVLVMPVQAGR